MTKRVTSRADDTFDLPVNDASNPHGDAVTLKSPALTAAAAALLSNLDAQHPVIECPGCLAGLDSTTTARHAEECRPLRFAVSAALRAARSKECTCLDTCASVRR